MKKELYVFTSHTIVSVYKINNIANILHTH